MHPLPHSLAPFFQEYDIATLNPETDSFTIIERTLQFGNRSELRWLFNTYSRKQIVDWVEYFGKDCLPQPHLNFWQIILETGEGVNYENDYRRIPRGCSDKANKEMLGTNIITYAENFRK